MNGIPRQPGRDAINPLPRRNLAQTTYDARCASIDGHVAHAAPRRSGAFRRAGCDRREPRYGGVLRTQPRGFRDLATDVEWADAGFDLRGVVTALRRPTRHPGEG